MAFVTVCFVSAVLVHQSVRVGRWLADVIASEILGPVWGV